MSENSFDWYTEWLDHVKQRKSALETLSNMWTPPPVTGTSSPPSSQKTPHTCGTSTPSTPSSPLPPVEEGIPRMLFHELPLWGDDMVEGPFEQLGTDIGRTVDDKRAKYGPAINVSSELLKLLYPNGVLPSNYWKATLFTRIADKLARIATDHSNDDEDPWADLVGYALIGTDECHRRKQNG